MNAGADGLRPLGRTGLRVSPVCVGTSPLASMPGLYGYEVSSERAEATILAALRGPVNFIDTSNNYGGGAAERRIGRALAAAGGLPPGFVLATKVDADPVTGDFSGERVRRSAAALQFSVRDPRVTSTVVGVSEPSRIAEITELMAAGIPDALWRQLDALAAPRELWLG